MMTDRGSHYDDDSGFYQGHKDYGDGGNYDFAVTLVMMNILKMIAIADIDIADVYQMQERCLPEKVMMTDGLIERLASPNTSYSSKQFAFMMIYHMMLL